MLDLLKELKERNQEIQEKLEEIQGQLSNKMYEISTSYSLRIQPSTTNNQLVYAHNVLKSKAVSAKELGLETNEYQERFESFVSDVRFMVVFKKLNEELSENKELEYEAKGLLTLEEKRQLFLEKASK